MGLKSFAPPVTLFEGTIVDSPAFGELRFRPHCVLAVDRNGIIAHVGQAGTSPTTPAVDTAIVEARLAGRVVRLEQGQFLIPGLVDCHIHAPQYSFAGTGLGLPLMGQHGWLERYAMPAERALSEDSTAARVRFHTVVSQTLRRGTTTALYYSTLHLDPTRILADTIDSLGQRGLVGKVCMDRHSPANYKSSAEQNIEDTEAFIGYVKAHCSNRIRAVVTPRFVPTCSEDLLRGLADLAFRHKCRVQTHVAESYDEVDFCRAEHPECPRDAAMLDKCGLLLGPGQAVLAHGVHLTDDELDMLATKGAAVAHCPLSNAYFANGAFRVRDALARGVRVGLGTDVAGGYDPSVLSALRAAVWTSCLLDNGVACYDSGHGVPEGAGPESRRPGAALTHVEAFWLATLGGATALGLDNRIGSFEAGKELDALVVDVLSGDSQIDVFPEDAESDLFQKFLHLGDDRNIASVYVQGRRVSGRPISRRKQVLWTGSDLSSQPSLSSALAVMVPVIGISTADSLEGRLDRGLLGRDALPRPSRHSHRVPVWQYLALLYWSVLLAAQYVLTRLVCQQGIPHDCHPDNDVVEVMHDFQEMLTLGFILAILTGIHVPERFRYLFCFHGPRPRGFVFLLVFFLSGPAFGYLDLVPQLQHISLTPAVLKDPYGLACAIGVAGGAVTLVLWHFVCAFRHNPFKGFLAYAAVRLAVWSFYAAYILVAVKTAGTSFHLHHYILGFLCAVLAEFNHPLSLLLLAGGAGIFVQGISAYEAAPIVEHRWRLFF